MGTVRDKCERDRALLSEENRKLGAEKDRVRGRECFGGWELSTWGRWEFVF